MNLQLIMFYGGLILIFVSFVVSLKLGYEEHTTGTYKPFPAWVSILAILGFLIALYGLPSILFQFYVGG